MSNQYPYNHYGQPPAPPKSNTGRNIAIGCGVVILIGFILIGAIVAFFALVFTSDAPESTTRNDQDTGIAFAGKMPGDVAVQAGATVTTDDVKVTASTLGERSGLLDDKLICSNIKIVNESDSTVSFNTLDWSLQSPGGAIETWGNFAGDDSLDSGQIAAGGSKTGNVCFDYVESPGEYVLLYEPSWWSSERYAWVSNL